MNGTSELYVLESFKELKQKIEDLKDYFINNVEKITLDQRNKQLIFSIKIKNYSDYPRRRLESIIPHELYNMLHDTVKEQLLDICEIISHENELKYKEQENSEKRKYKVERAKELRDELDKIEEELDHE